MTTAIKMDLKPYEQFLLEKNLLAKPKGKEDDLTLVHESLFPFQRDLVSWAMRKGRAAIFLDTGLGKTRIQLTWAQLMGERTLILAPLSVARQTAREGQAIGVDVHYTRSSDDLTPGINITNYEMVQHFNAEDFGAVVLDESSILKSFNGKTRRMLTEKFAATPYKLCCTATPAPNDVIEIGRHSEFLGIMTNGAMLSSFFVHEKSPEFHGTNYRLKGHAREAFWRWMASWSISMRLPSDLGYDDDGYILPPLTIEPVYVTTDYVPEGQLFFTELKGVQDRAKVRRETTVERVGRAAALVNKMPDQWIVWTGTNQESEQMTRAITDAVEVVGSDTPEQKAAALEAFQDGKYRVLVTKPSIAGFGMNFQNAHQQVFVGIGDSYEQYYQAIRRSYRFGQTKPVKVFIVLADVQSEILENVKRKEENASDMSANLIAHTQMFSREELFNLKAENYDYTTDEVQTDHFTMKLGDSVERMKEIPANSVGLIVYSPPFNDLFTYSPSERDLGNARSLDEFFTHYRYVIKDTLRVLQPGRTCVVHCENLLASRTHHGYIGMIDFRGDIIRAHQAEGWVYVGEITIDKDPQVQAIRTKNHRLLFQTLNKDTSRSRPGLADYLLLFEKPGENKTPIDTDVSEEEWILWARPVWLDIRETNVLNTTPAKGQNDEKHICPLQLDLIARCVRLWSNKGDVVMSPFAGIGSEGYEAVRHNRKFIGIELKPEYYRQAVLNLKTAETSATQIDLFTWAEMQQEASGGQHSNGNGTA